MAKIRKSHKRRSKKGTPHVVGAHPLKKRGGKKTSTVKKLKKTATGPDLSTDGGTSDDFAAF